MTESRPPLRLVRVAAWAVGITTVLYVGGYLTVADWNRVVIQVLAGLFGSAT